MADRTPGARPPEGTPWRPGDGALPDEVRVVIEVSRGGFIKRAPDGRIEFASPLPCPFNYGSAPDYPGQDGDPQDVVVLGPALRRGHEAVWPVRGRVRFQDQGLADPKWICSEAPLDDAALQQVDRFFSLYSLVKTAAARARGTPGLTRYAGVDVLGPAGSLRAWSGGITRARFRRPQRD